MPNSKVDHLLDIMTLLRDKERGCPWDIKQNFETIIPYTIEEAYEVLDAINKKDYNALKDELGDLLLQVVYHSRMAEEKELFNFSDVVKNVCEKMVRRHPHIFADYDREEWGKTKGIWEEQKSRERDKEKSVLDGVAISLPALSRGLKLQARAARVGFDWDTAERVIDKIEEEIKEVKEAIQNNKKYNNGTKETEGEIGDLLFACANLARKLDIDPEKALRGTNEKFIRRFTYIEKQLKAKQADINKVSLDEMEELWNDAKKLEKLDNAS